MAIVPRVGLDKWKKQLVEDERARGTVNQEIVPLDRRAEDARDNDALDLARLLIRAFSRRDSPHNAHDVPSVRFHRATGKKDAGQCPRLKFSEPL